MVRRYRIVCICEVHNLLSAYSNEINLKKKKKDDYVDWPTSEWWWCISLLSKAKTEVVRAAVTSRSVTEAITVAECIQYWHRTFINSPGTATITPSGAVGSGNVRSVFYKSLCSAHSLCTSPTRKQSKTEHTNYKNVQIHVCHFTSMFFYTRSMNLFPQTGSFEPSSNDL